MYQQPNLIQSQQMKSAFLPKLQQYRAVGPIEDYKYDALKPKKQMKEISNSIDSLSNLFMDPEGLKGIQRNPNTLNNRLWTARRYLGSSWTIPGQNAMKAVTNAKKEAEETIKAVNKFIQVDYLLFQETINGLRVKIFKEMQPVKIE